VPCGLVGEPVASLSTILGEECPKMKPVGDALLHHFSKVCRRELECFDAEGEMPPELHTLIHNQ
jgi:hypothetical protein